MRIISGSLKGRELKSPRGHNTRPMGEKARGGLFNVLGDVGGLSILDAFAGSGALAFEAVSRGAKEVIAIEQDRAAHSVIDQNVLDLKLQHKVHVVRANTAGWSIHNMEKRFDIVLLDPPYNELQQNLMIRLVNRHVKPNGLAVLSWPGKHELPKFANTELALNKNYGDIQLAFYRKVK